MASKLELTFNNTGVVNETLTIRTGVTFTFKDVRQAFHQVTADDLFLGARNFKDAFQIDENYTNESAVSVVYYTDTPLHSIVTIENNDNTFFDGFVNNTTFITHLITTTTQVAIPTLDITITEATTDKCNKYKVTVDSNVVNGRINIFGHGGETVLNINTDSTPYSIDLKRPSSLGNGIAKLYKDQTTNDVLLQKGFASPVIYSLNSVSVEGSPFGAAATVNTSNPLNLTYSLDNVSFQSSKEFAGLIEGSYTAYVKDAYGCAKSKTFEVTEAQATGLTADPYFDIAIHNSIRFADRNGESFLNLLSDETPGNTILKGYASDWLQSDLIPIQFKSSYKANKAFLIDCEGVETEIGVLQKSDNISRLNVYDGNYTDRDGRLAVYFTSGNVYETDGVTPKAEGHILNGNLPQWYEEGMFLRVDGVGVTQIDRIEYDEALETVYAITQKDALPDGLNVKITSLHTAHPFEVFEFDVNMNQAEGIYQVRIEYDGNYVLSEPIRINSELDDNYLTLQWYNDRNNGILYNTGIRQTRRIEWEDYFYFIGRSEIETYDTDTSVEKVNSKSFAVYGLNLMMMPMEVARGLKYGIDNSSTVIVNGAKFVAEKEVSLDRLGMYYLPKLELTLVDQTMDGQQNITDAVSTGFLRVDTDPDGTAFLKI